MVQHDKKPCGWPTSVPPTQTWYLAEEGNLWKMLASSNVMKFNVDGVWAGVHWPWRMEEPQATKDNWKNKVLFTKCLGPTSQLPVAQ